MPASPPTLPLDAEGVLALAALVFGGGPLLAGPWTELGPRNVFWFEGGMGRLNCVAGHPTDTNRLYVGAASGGSGGVGSRLADLGVGVNEDPVGASARPHGRSASASLPVTPCQSKSPRRRASKSVDFPEPFGA